jgi:hypothetical protein
VPPEEASPSQAQIKQIEISLLDSKKVPTVLLFAQLAQSNWFENIWLMQKLHK